MNTNVSINEQGGYTLDEIVSIVGHGIDNILYEMQISKKVDYDDIECLEAFFREIIMQYLKCNEKKFLAKNVILDNNFFMRFYVYNQEKLHKSKLCQLQRYCVIHAMKRNCIIEPLNAAIELICSENSMVVLNFNFYITQEGFFSKKTYFKVMMMY